MPEGYATGAAKGLTTADLPDNATWEQWFPADWVSEMREQIRLWFYSQLLMSVALTGKAPFKKVLGYEKMLDEHGKEMHGSWGNMIDAEDAFARMGADVMRWQYCAQPPDRNLLFGFGPAQEIKRQAADALELGEVPRGLCGDRVFGPVYGDLGAEGRRSSCSRWIAGSSSASAQLVFGGRGGIRALAHGRRHPRLHVRVLLHRDGEVGEHVGQRDQRLVGAGRLMLVVPLRIDRDARLELDARPVTQACRGHSCCHAAT